MIRRFFVSGAVLVMALSTPLAAAKATTPLQAIAAHDWSAAAAMAAASPDPVAGKIVTYYRMLTPGQASAAEIMAFMQQSPDWPYQSLLEARWEEALANTQDQATALGQCHTRWPVHAPALLRCATAFASASDTADAATAARRAWTGTGVTDPAEVSDFLSHWGSLLQPEDDWARFQALARGYSSAAAAEVPRLAAGRRQAATTWLALEQEQTGAAAALDALPQAAQAIPGLFLAGARYLRRDSSDEAAFAFWMAHGADAITAGTPAEQHALWREASYLARALITDGKPQEAYRLIQALPLDAGPDAADQEFLAGFIALRLLHDPAAAEPHFRHLAALSPAVITQARAHYWLGRTLAVEGRTMEATTEFQRAAAFPTTFYGQIAALAMGDSPQQLNARILAVRNPDWSTADALDFAGREVARAAALLASWGEPRRATGFLLDIAHIAPDAVDQAIAAELAQGFGIPQAGVYIARIAGADGTMLLRSGWPMPVSPPTSAGVEPATALGIMRQESSFDAEALSPSGALGLMQLMPATARLEARKQGVPLDSNWALTRDPMLNMTLGTGYFAGVLAHFDGCLPLAIAAYNAGPHRVDEWLAQNGDFRSPGGPDVLDWIELIPFSETRDYVQRVIEGIAIYRAQQGIAEPYPLQAWLH